MSKLPSIKSRDMLRILKEAGFHEDHRSGSHVIMHNETTGARVSIPYHGVDLARGTIHAILRTSGLTRDVLTELINA